MSPRDILNMTLMSYKEDYMPTQRFYNLPEEKKDRITKAIIGEFSQNGVDATDVASIVRAAEIPRGSFYQYFEDMYDVTLYIINFITDEKGKHLSGLMDKSMDIPFVDFYYNAFMLGLEFIELHPEFLTIGSYVMTSNNSKIKEYVNERTEAFYPYYEGLIEKDKASGVIKSDINTRALIQLLLNMTSHITIKFVYEDHKNIDEVKEIFEEMFNILKHGIYSKGGN